jgi:hypothetical protein
MKSLIFLVYLLLTNHPHDATVHVLHKEGVQVIHDNCAKLDLFTDVCMIPAGEQATELRVIAPCEMREVVLFTSTHYAPRTRINERVTVLNTCDGRRTLFMPLMAW